MTTTITGFPGFAPGEHRRLLADVSRWARTNGWTTHRDTGWQNPSRLTQVDWDERGLFIGSRNSVDHVWKTPRHWPATSVRQAVDILALIGLLPLVFSSAYQAGRSDKAFIGNVDTNPDRRCSCGATSGLRVAVGSPLALTYKQYECADGCKAGDR